jgi:hypothetical protein
MRELKWRYDTFYCGFSSRGSATSSNFRDSKTVKSGRLTSKPGGRPLRNSNVDRRSRAIAALYQLKSRWLDGTKAEIYEPLEFMEKPAASICPVTYMDIIRPKLIMLSPDCFIRDSR